MHSMGMHLMLSLSLLCRIYKFPIDNKYILNNLLPQRDRKSYTCSHFKEMTALGFTQHVTVVQVCTSNHLSKPCSAVPKPVLTHLLQVTINFFTRNRRQEHSIRTQQTKDSNSPLTGILPY